MNSAVIARALDSFQESLGGDVPHNSGLLGGIVDARVNAVDFVESLFNSRRTRRARHALDVELDGQRH